MSVWQFNAAIAGHVAAHFSDDGKALSEDDPAALWALIKGLRKTFG